MRTQYYRCCTFFLENIKINSGTCFIRYLFCFYYFYLSKRITNPDTTCLQMADKKKPNSADDRPQETDRQFLGNLSAVQYVTKS